MREHREAIEFARNYRGKDWNITSIDAYRYIDTGEWVYSANLVNRNWDGIGDREIRIMFSKIGGAFQARQVKLSKITGANLKPSRKIINKHGDIISA